MSVTQYIGARYVPIFLGEWDNSQPYEPLTVVQFEGASYTSRQSVPIGIDISNEEFWVLTGNYNAQVEAYRQEVRQFDGRISALEASQEEIDAAIEELKAAFASLGTLSVNMFDGSNPDNFTVRLIQADNANILIDSGNASDNTQILNWLRGKGVEHLDAFVLSHFHNDHCGNMEGIINSDLVDAETKIYRQMAATSANDQYTSSYEYWLNILVNVLASNGYPEAIIPVQGQTIEFGDSGNCKVTFYNTNENWAAAYDASWANNGTWEERTSSMNNYSLITRIENGPSSYVDTGDIEGEGQRMNAPYMQPCNVALYPHHFVNKMGFEDWHNKLNPEYWIVANHFHDEGERIDVYTYRLSYLYRYNTFNGLNKPILTNVSQDVIVDIENGMVTKANGFFIDASYNPDSRVLNESYANMLPPSYYNENPYIVYQEEFTLEMAQNIWRQYNQVLYPKAFYVPASTSTSSYAQTPFANAIRALFAPVEVTNVIQFTYDAEGHMEIGYSTVNTPWSRMNVISFNGNQMNNASWVPCKKGKVGFEVAGSWADNEAITGADYIRASNAIELTIDDNGTENTMAVYRVNGYPETNRNQAGMFEGMKLTGNANAVFIYQAYITLGGTLRIRKMNVKEGTYSADGLTVKRLRTIF